MEPTPEINITPIGVMRCGLKTTAETPAFYDESSEIGTLEIFAPYREAMEGLEAGQKIVVLFWLHKAQRDLFKVYPRGDRSRGLRGVFTTRSPMRPTPSPFLSLRSSACKRIILRSRGSMSSTAPRFWISSPLRST